MRLRFVPLVVLALLFSVSMAFADKAKAKDHFKKGQVKYTLEKWDEAIDEFEAGYEEEPDAVFLYNIAQAHRMAGRPKQALVFYHKFLVKRPDAPNRTEIEDQIKALEKMSSPSEALPPGDKGGARPAGVKPGDAKPAPAKPLEAKPAETKPIETKPAETRPVETASSATPASSTTPLVTKPEATEPPTATSEIPPGAVAPSPDEPKPAKVKKTWPIWVGVAAGVLVAGGAATAAIILTRSNATVLPPVDAR